MIKEGARFGGSEAFAGVGRANNNSNVGNANNVNGVAGAPSKVTGIVTLSPEMISDTLRVTPYGVLS